MSDPAPTETGTETGTRAPSARAASVGASEVSHGRYRLGPVIGVGGFGQVHEAVDRLTGEPVAIKFVAALSPGELARARRELAALRRLRLPGVVRLRDDGLDAGAWFMVMDLVDGGRFDAPRAGGWDAWSAPVLELLEILARVHLAGVLHLDLKPSNVRIDAAGRVRILDFGLARGRAVAEPGAGPIEGTRRYMAPEQAAGAPCDARTDLFAVGTMVRELPVDLPPAVAAVVAAMCAPDPADRPASAIAACTALAGRPPFPFRLVRSAPWTRDALAGLFAGNDRFTHLASDAAALLWERTGGEPVRVRETVEAWLLAGLVSWDEDTLTVDRLSLERLRSAAPVPDLLLSELPVLVDSACAESSALRARGHLDAALAVLEVVTPLVRSGPPAELERAEERLLTEWVLAAVEMERPDAVELALYALDRASPSPGIEPLRLLVRLHRAVLRGEASVARTAAAEVGPFSNSELEVWRMAYTALAAGLDGPEAEAELLAALEPWVQGDPHREAKRAGWLGNHLYRRGDFVGSALAHEQAMRGKVSALAAVASQFSAASSWLEALELTRAAQQASEAAGLARALRHPRYEATAVWMTRTAAYRSGRPLPPDPELIDAAAGLKPNLEALFAATDAATCFRAGAFGACATLAERAAARFAAAGIGAGALLMRALAAWVTEAEPGVLAALAESARGCLVPDIELQVLAFARWRVADPPADWLDRARALAALRPPGQWEIRLDVLSVAESLAAEPPGG